MHTFRFLLPIPIAIVIIVVTFVHTTTTNHATAAAVLKVKKNCVLKDGTTKATCKNLAKQGCNFVWVGKKKQQACLNDKTGCQERGNCKQTCMGSCNANPGCVWNAKCEEKCVLQTNNCYDVACEDQCNTKTNNKCEWKNGYCEKIPMPGYVCSRDMLSHFISSDLNGEEEAIFTRPNLYRVSGTASERLLVFRSKSIKKNTGIHYFYFNQMQPSIVASTGGGFIPVQSNLVVFNVCYSTTTTTNASDCHEYDGYLEIFPTWQKGRLGVFAFDTTSNAVRVTAAPDYKTIFTEILINQNAGYDYYTPREMSVQKLQANSDNDAGVFYLNFGTLLPYEFTLAC